MGEHGEAARRPKQPLKGKTRTRAASNGTLETATTSSTAAGRSYTVANVHHGVIYLRPVVRPAHHRLRPPHEFVFPQQTPPDSASARSSSLRHHSTANNSLHLYPPPPHDAHHHPHADSHHHPHADSHHHPHADSHHHPPNDDWQQSLYGAATPRSEPTPPLPHLDPQMAAGHADHAHHLRSHSFSTLNSHTATTAQSSEPGTFKVVIERPPFARPKTADTSRSPLLQVPIPTYRLGTPRFTTRGASPTVHLSSASSMHTFPPSRPHSDAYASVPYRYRATMDRPPLPTSAPSSARLSSHAPIGPRLYDALTLNPDDPALVRFSSTGDILAATPSRLVAHITSPSFLDYELLSDFFLTFRAFLSTKDLIAYLISRLQWAVDRQDDFGRIVRVRTFVALRHWILNYFVDDFVPYFKLRAYFCQLVNHLYASLRARQDKGGGDIKIVGELKKCWRRTCALYWETNEMSGQNSADDELLPGGQVESHASVEDLALMPPVPSSSRQPSAREPDETMGSNPSDQFASRYMDWAQRARHTPQNSMGSPFVTPSHEYDMMQAPLSPASEQSMHVLSCSIPLGMSKVDQNIDLPLYPHPVPASTGTAQRRVASPQQPNSLKRTNRPSHGHKRSGSFSDALRDSRTPLSIPKNASLDAMSMLTTMPGSLVRGGLVQPRSAYFELKNVASPRSKRLAEQEESSDDQQRSAHTSSPGMKKILGTVRRALSTRQALNSSPQLGPHRTHPRPSNPGINLTTGGASSQRRRAVRPKPQVRYDTLAAMVAESFKEAYNAQLERQQQLSQTGEPIELGGFEFEFEGRSISTVDPQRRPSQPTDPRAYSTITTGSKSILIIDDTGAPPLPEMAGALPVDTEQPEASDTPIESHEESTSIAERLAKVSVPLVAYPDVHDETPIQPASERRSKSQPPTKRPPTESRRSLSAGREQMHSFKRRGSTKTLDARSSLRRHASYNSGLSRHRAADSVATFQTLSSVNDPFVFDRTPATATPGPARQLRRRPGGDLRAVDNVHDLEMVQRPHSTGSVSNCTHSITNSVALCSDRYNESVMDSMHRAEGPPNTQGPKKAISLVDTHSSQPNLRPSFEAEVAKLAALPDDTDDEGGVESALMKLEGRYEKKSPSIPSRRVTVEVYQPTGAPTRTSRRIPSEHEETDIDQDNRDTFRPGDEHYTRRVPAISSVGESTDSYSSIPLLDRDLKELKASPRATMLAQPPRTASSENSSMEYAVEKESTKRLRCGANIPTSSVVRESFLLDEDEDLSDMSSTTTVAKSDRVSRGPRSFFNDDRALADCGGRPMHPMRHPATPPLSVDQLKDPMHNPTVFEKGLPTPGLTPTTSRLGHQTFVPALDPVGPYCVHPGNLDTSTAHLPFVLAYDSESLAQQFTIVEKDALDEIDWKELIELRWKQSSPQIRDWVQYLRTEEARGVDVVIARFNLVVKWVMSECVLTESMDERARCITKYIHIAAHARRLRNYATMYQISIALISNDVARLKNTWALVPAAERHTMKELEALVQPLKNFHNLRLEMETTATDDGCIPFIGIYTRDLIYNAQKPAFVDAPPADGEKLVNFDRHHTAATIVKNLLRLLEASSKYTYKPDPQLVSKCLWLAALSDEEISTRSRQCE